MDVDPVAVGIFKAFVKAGGFRRHVALGQAGFFHKLHLKSRGRHDVDGKAAGLGFGVGPLQHPFACAAVKGWFDRRVSFLEGVDEADDLFVVERAIKHHFAFAARGFLQCGRVG